jgi:hypothetical protein
MAGFRMVRHRLSRRGWIDEWQLPQRPRSKLSRIDDASGGESNENVTEGEAEFCVSFFRRRTWLVGLQYSPCSLERFVDCGNG